jgi:hypothetical protein
MYPPEKNPMQRLIATFILLVCVCGVAHSDNGTLPLAQDFPSAEVQRVERFIDHHGKYPIIDFILQKRQSAITLDVGGALRIFYGMPDPIYVTAYTILIDLAHLETTFSAVEGQVPATNGHVGASRPSANGTKYNNMWR